MNRWLGSWHRSAATGALLALVIPLIPGDALRQLVALSGSSPPSGANRSPVEEHEKAAEEVLAPLHRHRTRCGQPAVTAAAQGRLVGQPLPRHDSRGYPTGLDPAHPVTSSWRSLPLRC
jgi:hypothetical protein